MALFYISIHLSGNNAWILTKSVFRQRVKYENYTMWFNGLLCSDLPLGQEQLIHTVSAGFLANFTEMKRLQKVTRPSLEIFQHIWNWHAMISDLAFKENKKRLHWWIVMKSLIDQHRRLNHLLSSTDFYSFLTLDVAVKELQWEKAMQKHTGCAPQSIPQPSSANQTMCQKSPFGSYAWTSTWPLDYVCSLLSQTLHLYYCLM